MTLTRQKGYEFTDCLRQFVDARIALDNLQVALSIADCLRQSADSLDSRIA